MLNSPYIRVDGFSMLRELVQEIPREVIPCVYHTHVANQITQEAQRSLLKTVR